MGQAATERRRIDVCEGVVWRVQVQVQVQAAGVGCIVPAEFLCR